ncbi:hypothetical protein [Ruegeria conchae]|uniref:Uncharacterized protein n=1 Tax=Ruegeria conchae TaxID=981384 RepID=A0A497ZFD8_9RHOB|nr:hypothetical protein [Ruegeria conchae]RLK07430.1 hypothetical protein CLV75_2553 [Ruegeria conchae]
MPRNELLAFLFGLFWGAVAVFWYMKDRPATPYDVCMQYWGQKYYSDGSSTLVAEKHAEPHCEYEKTAFDGDISNG